MQLPNGIPLVYNGHLFTRYRERMNLEISDTMDVVKHFFTCNRDMSHKIMPKENDRMKIIGIVKQGFLLGEVILDNVMMIHKTFISHDTANMFYAKSKVELALQLKKNLAECDDPETKEDLVSFYNALGLKEDGNLKENSVESYNEILKDLAEFGNSGYYIVK